MKITPNRPFPKFIHRQTNVKPLPGHQKVLFLRDPFTHYVEPEVERAAFDILFAMEFDVEVLTIVGDGASLLSKGFVSAARQQALRMMDELKSRDPNNSLPIVGIEPSEIYFLKHDYSDLLPERRLEISTITGRTWLLEEFLVRSNKFLELRVVNNHKKILFHPHCHQKAESPANDGKPNGTNATVEFLRQLGFHVEVIEAGCCGMAGTFGYEAEHYEISQQIGGLKLFPAIRNHENDYLIAATGAACRMQIVQGTGKTAEHPIVLAGFEIGSFISKSRNLTT